MKILNRPMFRMGGPIKEGIMNNIKEPRQGYKQSGMVFPNDIKRMMPNASKVFADVSKNYMPSEIINQTSMIPEPALGKSNTSYNTGNFIDEGVGADINLDIPKRIPIPKYIPDNDGDGIRDLNPEWEKANWLEKNVTGVTKEVVEPGKETEVVRTGPAELGLTTRKLPTTDDPPGTGNGDDGREKNVKSILEKLGYARSQKNALYDALIKGGQRIAREGLGKQGLVNDLIADTSTSYDKPEKIREAAELMQVQQDLKLEGIDRSKDNRGTIQKNADYYQSKDGGGYSKEVSIRMARNLPTTMSEYFAASKATSNQAKLYDATRAATKDGKLFGNVDYMGKINKKKYENISDFLITSPDDGVYNILGRVIVIKDGEKVTEVVVQPEVDSKGWFKKSE